MADTRHHSGHAGPGPVEGDGISYSGLVWFVIILTATTVFCMAIVWGLFEWMDRRETARDPARPAVAGAPVTPGIVDGRIVGDPNRSGPDVLVEEPFVLDAFRSSEEALLTTYGWVDQNAGIARIPIERAKDLLIEKGLPVR